MSLRDPAPFYAALERFGQLESELRPRFAWGTNGDGPRRVMASTAPTAPTEATASPEAEAATARVYIRETYLVPDWPALEARSPDGRWFASAHAGNVLLRDAQTERRLTDDGSNTVAWDIEGHGSDPWSPDGRWLLALRFDRSAIARVVRPRLSATGQTHIEQPRQQFAGGPLDRVLPWVLAADGSQAQCIDLGLYRDGYLRLLDWLPDSGSVLLARYSRLLDRVEVWRHEVTSGKSSCVFTETSPTFLQNCKVGWGAPTGFRLLDGERFLWLSEREGRKHLYLGQLGGGELRRLTQGEIVVHDVLRHDAGWVYLRAATNPDRPYDLQLLRISLSNGEQQQLTSCEGQHDISFSPDGLQFIDTVSSPSRPPVSGLRDADGTQRGELWRADIAPLRASGWTVPEEVVVRAADGHTDLHGVLYKPPHFDPARCYPLVQWVYGGPQLVHTSHGFAPRPGGSDAFVHAMTDAGYLVLTLDARGTPGRDKAFQDAAYREWGAHVVADQAGALRQLLAARACIDPTRLGVAGRSWGGYFALRMLAQAGDLYRAASCIVPGFNPYGGNIWEPYLGLPQDDPRPYEDAEPWGWPQQLAHTARVQLIGGLLDSSTLWDLHRMARLLAEADVSTQMLVLPEQDHVFEGPAQRYHYRAVRDFFDEALAP